MFNQSIYETTSFNEVINNIANSENIADETKFKLIEEFRQAYLKNKSHSILDYVKLQPSRVVN